MNKNDEVVVKAQSITVELTNLDTKISAANSHLKTLKKQYDEKVLQLRNLFDGDPSQTEIDFRDGKSDVSDRHPDLDPDK